jgi:uncharacterized protein
VNRRFLRLLKVLLRYHCGKSTIGAKFAACQEKRPYAVIQGANLKVRFARLPIHGHSIHLQRRMMMQKNILGRTDMAVSVIGFGGIPIQRVSEAEASRILNHALDRGVNFIDTARGYTDSESKIGKALKSRRGEYLLASKALSRDAAGMTKELETSLRELQTDCIDLYQLHAIGSQQQLDQVLGPDGAYGVLQKARTEGKVRFIGVTGHGRDILKTAIETDAFDTLQHPFNPIETEWEELVMPAAKARNIGLICMKPVAGGAIDNVPAALRFSLHKGMDVLIPGMDSVEQVDENCAVGEILQPPTSEELAILAAEKEAWGDRFCRRCGYCMPCPNGLHIPMLLLLQGYSERYGMKDWARERLSGLDKKYDDCVSCGDCLSRCPYQLKIPEFMGQAQKDLM